MVAKQGNNVQFFETNVGELHSHHEVAARAKALFTTIGFVIVEDRGFSPYEAARAVGNKIYAFVHQTHGGRFAHTAGFVKCWCGFIALVADQVPLYGQTVKHMIVQSALWKHLWTPKAVLGPDVFAAPPKRINRQVAETDLALAMQKELEKLWVSNHSLQSERDRFHNVDGERRGRWNSSSNGGSQGNSKKHCNNHCDLLGQGEPVGAPQSKRNRF